MQCKSSMTSTSIASLASSSHHAVSGGATENRDEVDTSIIFDLTKHECCDMESMLDVLLNRCRDLPPPPNTGSIPSTPQLLSTENYPDGSPGEPSKGTARASTATPQYHGSPDPNSEGNPADSSAQPNESPTDPPTQPDLLQLCLQAALGHCEDAELQGFLDEFKNGKGKAGYVPLAKALNRALSLSSTIQLPGIRGPSDLQILFTISDPKNFDWRPDVLRSPSLVILSLGATRRLYEMPNADWNSLSEACLTPPEKVNFEWPDVLAPVGVKWNDDPIDSGRPAKYSTGLAPIGHLSIDDSQKDSSEATSSNTSPTSTTVSSSIQPSEHESPELIQSSGSVATTGSIPSSHSGRSSANVSGQAAISSQSAPPKCPSDYLGSNTSRPQNKHERNKGTRSDVVTQSAGNGTEMLHCSLGRHHSISLAIIDSKMWLWWYHPQGAIQTTGIDFIQNLPHLFVLLFALQRLSLADWGFNLEPDPPLALRHLPQPPETGNSTSNPPRGPTDHALPSSESTNSGQRILASGHQRGAFGDGQQGEGKSTNGKQENSSDKKMSSKTEAPMPWIQPMSASVTVNEELKIRYNVPMLAPLDAPFCLHGRSTRSFEITDNSDANASDDSPKSYMAKLYWPYMSRFKEQELIQETRGVAHDLGNHLPRVIGSCDIDPTSTLRIRKELDLNQVPSSTRALRMIIFERLTPITDLQGDKFLIALVECMRCHYVLWHTGIRHQDISLANLMIRTIGDRYHGVLNDWDLSFWEGHGEFEADLTATVPYVAIRLLYLWQDDPNAKRIYYFELESFFWCMIWTFLAFKNRKFQPILAAASWLTGDFSRSADTRCGFFFEHGRFQAYEEWKPYQKMSLETSRWIHDRTTDLVRANELDGDSVLLRNFLEMVSQNVAGLEMPTSPAIKDL
ncbi:NACHT, LRR and PYD domains-containing protein 1 [Rhizoctonia solani]|uniref:NACHT, LRR and PYD domains-containing protein 1 n=1 Tax=Rhizoctonia solani TaxID=456999 RepID=A0A0K6G364_9AGAM|nr:NACHT, LRR and PYD domains-containing protein 1 [Rhizoctonia solani]